MRTFHLGMATALVVALTLAPASARSAPDIEQTRQAHRAAYPHLVVRRLVTGLDHPWDVRSIGHGRLLYTQRDRASLTVWSHGRQHRVRFPSRSVWVSGETGLMGLAVD